MSDNKNCKICNSESSIVYDYKNGESVCTVCGAVIPEDEDETSQSLQESGFFYTSDDIIKKSQDRTREQESRHNQTYGLATMIYANDINVNNGSTLSREQIHEAYKLQYLNTNLLNSKATRLDRSLIQANHMLDKIKSEFNLSEQVIQRALYLYKQSKKHKMIKGRSVAGIISVCLYIAFKEFKIPRRIDEITIQLGIPEGHTPTVRKYYRDIIKKLNLNYNNINGVSVNNAPKFLHRYINRLGLSIKLYHRAVEIIKIIAEKDPSAIAGRKPSVLELGALYYAYKEDYNSKPHENKNEKPISMVEFAGIFNSTEVSMRNTVKLIKKYVE